MCKVSFWSVFRALSQNFKILAIPNVLAYGKSYEHGFVKKYNGHKLCAKSHFNRFFRAPSRNFKILVIPNVLAHEKSYEHGFVKNATVINIV
ncbi:hypothetical protein B296_00034302 [Ensete ventricosum]|uniref:Uncharacterized protein n=1 Tax=Ensete ventricosum TaxID=4639 RepID=A0A426ZWE8_ENSVE|nr:hypothetical protein B296_00034302 [Ensete ventricosum]